MFGAGSVSCWPLIALLTLSASACGTVELGASADPTLSEDDLWAQKNVMWPKKAPSDKVVTLSVCWESPGNDAFKAIAQQAVTGSWQAAAAIDFVGWGACTNAPTDLRVKNDDSQPIVETFGRGLKNMRGGINLNFVFKKWPSRLCDEVGMTKCIAHYAMHEFGHAIGFLHEQDRPDAPKRCPEDNTDQFTGTLANAGFTLTKYDGASVMNYCPIPLKDTLSALDIAGVRRAYGKRIL
jgi:hypothetical protein